MIAELLRGAVALLAPPRCPGCDLVVPPCVSAPHTPTGGFCPACEPLLEPAPVWLRPPVRAAAPWLYQGPLADSIRRFKYAGNGWLARPLGALIADAARPYAGRIDAVVPVALHRSKLRERGYNPAALLARPVASAIGAPLHVGWLRRLRATRSQAGLPRDERLANVRGAFRAPAARPCRVLLVDDVRTTGSTLAEAAATLAGRGHDVTTLALAWAEA